MPGDFKFLTVLLAPLLLLGIVLPNGLKDTTGWKGADAHLSTFSELMDSTQGTSADVIFLGTSRTMNGIHSPELNRLSHRSHLNLGLNWFGHGLRLNQLYSWLKVHSPKAVVIEVPLLFHFEDHPHLAHTLQSPTLKSLWTTSPLKAIKAQLLQFPRWTYQHTLDKAPPENLRLAKAGYLPINTPAGLGTGPSQWAEHLIAKMTRAPLPWPHETKQAYYHFRYCHQWEFLRSMADLCKARQTKFFLLAIPKCGFDVGDPWLQKKQAEIAPLWIPPSDLLQHADLWRDIGHLNEKGALKLATWLNSQLEKSL